VPWGGDTLAACTDKAGSVAKRLKALPYCSVLQDRDDGANVVFPADRFQEVAATMKPRRRSRLPERLVRYVTPEDFESIYQVCDQAKRPEVGNYSPGDWWRALIVFAYMTGWRISEMLALCWDDVSLDNGTALTRWQDNKGRRDALAPLNPVVIDHVRRVADSGRLVFLWPHHRRTLWEDFHTLQKAAGIGVDAVYGSTTYGGPSPR
jgi:integrase